MIHSVKQLKLYLYDDSIHFKKKSNFFQRIKHEIVTNPINCQTTIYYYIKYLRYAEYHYNNSVLVKKKMYAWWHTLMMIYYYKKLKNLSYKTGFQIPPNTCGPGLMIYHYGYLIINENVRIGKNATLYPGIEIGDKNGCPTIGDNVFIGAGSKIFGPIHIGNNVTIAANAVVVKDIPDNAIVGGVPAKIIKFKNESSAN